MLFFSKPMGADNIPVDLLKVNLSDEPYNERTFWIVVI